MSLWKLVMHPPPTSIGSEDSSSFLIRLRKGLLQHLKPVNVGDDILHTTKPIADLAKNVIALSIHMFLIVVVLCAVFYSFSIFRFRFRHLAIAPHSVSPKMFDGNSSFDSFLESLERYLEPQLKLDETQRCQALRSRLNAAVNSFIDDNFLSEHFQGLQEDYPTVRDLARTYYGTNQIIDDFLTDTGAERTIVHKSLIQEEWWSTIIPTYLTMVVASGTEAPLLGELDCNIKLGNTFTPCRVLVTSDLNATCLLGMDVLTQCPLTKGPIRLLHEAVLSGISTEKNRDVETKSRNGTNLVQWYRAQVLTPRAVSGSRWLRAKSSRVFP